MLDQFKNEMETDAMVKLRNGKTLYGIILDYFAGMTELGGLKFVPNDFLQVYRATENPRFVITLDSKTVTAVDVCLK